MTSYIVMFDSTDPHQIPAGPAAVAGYVGGRWPDYGTLRAMFPHARALSIAVNAGEDADCLDVETGDATPGQAPAWAERQHARGITRPCIYASVEPMQAEVIPALRAANIDRAAVRLWSAHYAGKHICGPGSCSELSTDADGTQWTDVAFGRDLDQSLLIASFFTATPPPPQPAPAPSPSPDWQEEMMNKLPELTAGASDKPGQVQFVHRAQALTALYGSLTGLAEAAALKVDGLYGPATKTAVQQVQGHAKTTQDGTVGPQTWSVLVTGAP